MIGYTTKTTSQTKARTLIRGMMAIAIIVIMGSAIAFARAQTVSQSSSQGEADRFVYADFDKDVVLLRDTVQAVTEDGPMRASSQDAMLAAVRVFGRVSFLHRSRAEVLAMLGDPGTLNDFAIPAEEGEDSSLMYLFEAGWGGPMYTLTFDKGDCVGVAVEFLQADS